MLAKSSGPVTRADVEAAVEAFLGHALLEDHHAAHRGRALGVGDIVALDAVGRRGQSQAPLAARPGPAPGGGYRPPTGLVSAARVSAAFSAAIWISSCCWPSCGTRISTFSPPRLCAQPLLDDLGFFHLLGQQHLGGDGGRLVVELLDELGDHVWRRAYPRCPPG